MIRWIKGAALVLALTGTSIAAHAQTQPDAYDTYKQLVSSHQYHAAQPYALIAYETAKEKQGANDIQTGLMASALADSYRLTGNLILAIARYQEAYRILTSPANVAKGQPYVGSVLSSLASAHTDLGDYKDAAPLYDQWLSSNDSQDEQHAHDRFLLLLDAARNQRQMSLEKAVDYAQAAQKLASKAYGKYSDEAMQAQLAVGEIYMAQGKRGKAKRTFNGVVRRNNVLAAKAALQDMSLMYYQRGDIRHMWDALRQARLGSNNTSPGGLVTPGAIACAKGTEDTEDPWAYVAYDVTEEGDVVNPQVIAADPPLVQDAVILRVLSYVKQPPLEYRNSAHPRYDLRILIHCVRAEDATMAEEADDPFTEPSRNDVRLQFARIKTPAGMAQDRADYVAQVLAGRFDDAIGYIQGHIQGLLEKNGEVSEEGAVLAHDLALTELASLGPRSAATQALHALDLAKAVYGPAADKMLFPYLLLADTVSPDKRFSQEAISLAKSAFGANSEELAAAILVDPVWRPSPYRGKIDRAPWDRAGAILRTNKSVSAETLAEYLYTYGHRLMRQPDSKETEAGRALLMELIDGPGPSLAPGNRFLRAAHYTLQQYYGMRGNMTVALEHAREANMGNAGDLQGLVSIMPVKDARAIYPVDAGYYNIHGFVLVAYTVQADGTVSDVKSLASWPPGVFDAATAAAVKQFQYVPYFKDGKAVETHNVLFRMTYVLEK